MQISTSVRVMTPMTVMRMHSALTQRGVTPAPAILVTLEMESTVQVRCCISEVGTLTCTLFIIPLIIQSPDVNECELEIHTCRSNANCTDTDGSFNCTCGEGFEGDGFNCTGKVN